MIVYISKTILCSGLLLSIYWWLLQKEKMHRFNRIYLLFSIAFSLLVPLIIIEGEKEILPFAQPVYVVQSTTQTNALEITSAETRTVDPPRSINFAIALYGSVCLLLLVRFFKNLTVLIQRSRAYPRRDYRGAKLVQATDAAIPYSFLCYIFVDKEILNNESQENAILRHELAHVKQRHSLDILFVELLLVFAWFNPFFYGFRKAIRLNHEFLADDAVVKSCGDPAAYQRLLLKKLSASPVAALASSFHYLIIKKRLVMITQKTSPQTGLLKKVAVLPLIVLLLFTFSAKQVIGQQESQSHKTEVKPERMVDSLYRNFWIQSSIGSTKEGLDGELVKEYEALAEKNFPSGQTTKNHWHQLSKKDKTTMEGLFRQMSQRQQLAQRVFFTKPTGPLPKVAPSKQQLQNFKKSSTYGLWIDGKKAFNSDLNNHDDKDFSQVFVSKLYGAAKKGRSYTHQVNLMTNAYYENYVKETNANKESEVAIKWPLKEKE